MNKFIISYNTSLNIEVRHINGFELKIGKYEPIEKFFYYDLLHNARNYYDYLIELLLKAFPKYKSLISPIEQEKKEIKHHSWNSSHISFVGGAKFDEFCARKLKEQYVFNKKHNVDNFVIKIVYDTFCRKENIKKAKKCK